MKHTKEKDVENRNSQEREEGERGRFTAAERQLLLPQPAEKGGVGGALTWEKRGRRGGGGKKKKKIPKKPLSHHAPA